MLKFINKTRTPTTVEIVEAVVDSVTGEKEQFVRLVKGAVVQPGEAAKINAKGKKC